LAVLFVALLPRLFVAIAWSKEPVWDGHYYHFGAERIAAGLGYSEDVWQAGRLVWKPWIHYPVGYSALLAIPYRLFGADLVIAPVLNAILGALLAFVTHRFARHLLSTTRARFAGALVALHPGLIVYSALVMTEIAAALFLMLAGLVALAQRGRLRGSLGAGALFGVGALIRPTSLLALPFVAAAEHPRRARAAKSALLAILCAGVVILPWTIRNCRTFDGCAAISTNGGWNLAIGAITTTGRFETLRASDGCRAVTGQVQQDRCWAEVGWSKIAAAPLEWLARAPKKLGETFNHESFAIEYLHEADPVSWTEERRVAGRELTTFAHRALLLFAALGVIARPIERRHRPPAFWVQAALAALVVGFGLYAFASDQHPFYVLALLVPVIAALPLPGRPALGAAGFYAAGLLFTVIVAHVVFFGEDRYHLVVSPILCVFAAGALRDSSPLA
jgi:4-amino-4-deoxy-L-arabinose transferase-like glycosyltransferase